MKEDDKDKKSSCAWESWIFSGRAPFESIDDHPFLFFIQDTSSGLILFMGRVTDPRGVSCGAGVHVGNKAWAFRRRLGDKGKGLESD